MLEKDVCYPSRLKGHVDERNTRAQALTPPVWAVCCIPLAVSQTMPCRGSTQSALFYENNCKTYICYHLVTYKVY